MKNVSEREGGPLCKKSPWFTTTWRRLITGEEDASRWHQQKPSVLLLDSWQEAHSSPALKKGTKQCDVRLDKKQCCCSRRGCLPMASANTILCLTHGTKHIHFDAKKRKAERSVTSMNIQHCWELLTSLTFRNFPGFGFFEQSVLWWSLISIFVATINLKLAVQQPNFWDIREVPCLFSQFFSYYIVGNWQISLLKPAPSHNLLHVFGNLSRGWSKARHNATKHSSFISSIAFEGWLHGHDILWVGIRKEYPDWLTARSIFKCMWIEPSFHGKAFGPQKNGFFSREFEKLLAVTVIHVS